MEINFNDKESVNAYIAQNKTQTEDAVRNFISAMSKILSHVEEHEIIDINWGDELNRKHSETVKMYDKFSFLSNREELLINKLKNTLMKLKGQVSSSDDNEEKKRLNKQVDFVEMEIEFFSSKSSKDQKSAKGKTPTKHVPIARKYKSLDEIFIEIRFVEPCIDVLRNVVPPLIGNKLNYIGKSKSAFKVWLNELHRLSFISHCTDIEYIQLLNEKFKDLSIGSKDGSTFRKPNKRADEQYKAVFDNLLSQLSQNGMKGK